MATALEQFMEDMEEAFIEVELMGEEIDARMTLIDNGALEGPVRDYSTYQFTQGPSPAPISLTPDLFGDTSSVDADIRFIMGYGSSYNPFAFAKDAKSQSNE